MGSLRKKILKSGKAKWYLRFKDEHGRWVERAGSTDKAVAQKMLADAINEVERRKAGLRSDFHDHASRPIADHLEDFRGDMASGQNTREHVDRTVQMCQRIIEGCGWKRITDIDDGQVRRWLAGQRASRDDCGIRTSNKHQTAIKSFSRWLWTSKRLMDHPLKGLKNLNCDLDRRHDRRVLTDQEFASLLETTRTSTRVDQGRDWRFDGEDRWLLYLTAALTGLRASELASLTVKSFDPKFLTVSVEATNTKNKEPAEISIPDGLAVELRNFVSERQLVRNDHLWGGSWAEQRMGGKMIRRDLAEAGIAHKDDNGKVFDFHALRTMFGTNLARADVSLTKAQDAMRHSTPYLTKRFYTKLQTTDIRESINRLSIPKITP